MAVSLPVRTLAAAVAAMLLTCGSLTVVGREPVRVTESEARAWAVESATIADGTVRKFNAEFQKRAKKRIRDYRPGGYRLSLGMSSAGLNAVLYGQVAAFQVSASEAVRTFRPVNGATWRPGVTLQITTRMVTSPVIERAVLRRGSDVTEATHNQLMTLDAKNLDGAVLKTREGSLLFSIDAFDPQDGDARMILIPVAGRNFEVKLRELALSSAFERPK